MNWIVLTVLFVLAPAFIILCFSVLMMVFLYVSFSKCADYFEQKDEDDNWDGHLDND